MEIASNHNNYYAFNSNILLYTHIIYIPIRYLVINFRCRIEECMNR